jgi:hypothetical protein
MTCSPPQWFERVITAPRLSPYHDAARRRGTHAEDLYRWNLQVSEAFYPALSCLEICMRNALDERLKAKYSRADWWTSAPLAQKDIDKVRRVSDDLGRWRGSTPSPDDIVSELSFGFWVALLSRRYDRHLWVPALHRAFPGYRGPREQLRDNFESMCFFRNRVMHHEPVHHRDLASDHLKIYRLLGYIEPEAVAWLRGFDRVPETLTKRPGGDERAS